MEIGFEIESEEFPGLDEAYHLFGDASEYLFMETEKGGERNLYLIDFNSQELSEMDYSERSWYRTGATVWRLEDNDCDIGALVTPSAENARRGVRPEIHYSDPVEDSEINDMLEEGMALEDVPDPLASWFSARENVGETGEAYGKAFVSKGNEV